MKNGCYLTIEEKRRIGRNLRKLAREKGLTQRNVAQELGIRDSTIGAYETGRTIPSTEIAFKYKELFQISLEEIFGRKLAKRYESTSSTPNYKYFARKKSERKIGSRKMQVDRKNMDLSLEEMARRINDNFKLDQTKNTLSDKENGVAPVDYELATAYAFILGTKPQRYFRDKAEKVPAELARTESSDGVYSTVEKRDLIERVLEALPERSQIIVKLSAEGWTTKSIGRRLRITGTRVQQIRDRIKRDMKDKFLLEFI